MQQSSISLAFYVGLLIFIVVLIGDTLTEVWIAHPVRITASALLAQLPLLLWAYSLSVLLRIRAVSFYLRSQLFFVSEDKLIFNL